MKLVFVKQQPTKTARYYGLDQFGKSGGEDGISVNPNAVQSFSPRVESDNRTWVTGLNEDSVRVNSIKDDKERKRTKERILKERENLEKLLGVDLKPHSDYWLTYRMSLIDRNTFQKKLDLDRPEHLLMYTVAVENRYLAPDYDSLYDPAYQETGAFLYVYNPGEELSRRQQLQESKDEVASLLFTSRRNVDKLYYWCAALNKSINRAMSAENLYALLTTHRDSLKTVEDYDKFKGILNWDNERLQVSYLFKLAQRKRSILKEKGDFMLADVNLGKSEADAVEFLRLSENSYLLDKLIALDPQTT